MSKPTPPRTTLTLDLLEARDVPSATLDLTARGTFGEINGARFEQHDARPTGTGVIQSFVRVQALGNRSTVEQGVNTDARPLLHDENKSPQFTRSIRVADLPLVNLGGTSYREVLLDINQKASASQLSLDELKVFVGGAGNLNYHAGSGTLGGAAPVYDLDWGGDHWVKLDARLNSGSGSGDMRFYVPNDLLVGGEFFYLYSKFGENIAANGGFEEWAAGAGGASVAPDTASFSGVIIGPGTDGPRPVAGGFLYVYGSDGREIDVVEVGGDGTFVVNNFELLGTSETFTLVYDSGNPNTPGLAPGPDEITLTAGVHLTDVELRLTGA